MRKIAKGRGVPGSPMATTHGIVVILRGRRVWHWVQKSPVRLDERLVFERWRVASHAERQSPLSTHLLLDCVRNWNAGQDA